MDIKNYKLYDYSKIVGIDPQIFKGDEIDFTKKERSDSCKKILKKMMFPEMAEEIVSRMKETTFSFFSEKQTYTKAFDDILREGKSHSSFISENQSRDYLLKCGDIFLGVYSKRNPSVEFLFQSGALKKVKLVKTEIFDENGYLYILSSPIFYIWIKMCRVILRDVSWILWMSLKIVPLDKTTPLIPVQNIEPFLIPDFFEDGSDAYSYDGCIYSTIGNKT